MYKPILVTLHTRSTGYVHQSKCKVFVVNYMNFNVCLSWWRFAFSEVYFFKIYGFLYGRSKSSLDCPLISLVGGIPDGDGEMINFYKHNQMYAPSTTSDLVCFST